MASKPERERIPFLVLTGFLGSGKTTVLNRLLRQGGQWLVLMNEFGKTPLDQQLLQRRDLPLGLLSGGCVCCTVRGALAPVLRNFHMARGSGGVPHFDAVVMETSGVADPGPVLDTLSQDRWLAARYRLSAIVATVDVRRGLAPSGHYPEAARQVALADRLLITQADLATGEAVETLRQGLRRMNPAADIVVTAGGNGEGDSLLVPAFSKAGGLAMRLAMPLGDATDFESASAVFGKPLRQDAQAVLQRLVETLGRRIPRIKGILDIEGEPGPIVVHGVEGQFFPISRLTGWPDGDRRSRIVAIGAAADHEAIAQFLDRFAQAMEGMDFDRTA